MENAFGDQSMPPASGSLPPATPPPFNTPLSSPLPLRPNGATTEKSRKIAIEGKRWKVQKDTSHDSSTNRKQRCSAFEGLHRAAILDRTTRYSSTDETTKGKMVLFV